MKPPSRYDLPRLDELPEDVRARIEEVQQKSGFVPNVFLVLARRPAEFRAFFAYHDALMDREGGLSKADKEMIVVATSAANDCTYCVVAHGAILRIYAKNPRLADQIAVNYPGAEITERQRVMLDVAVKLAVRPQGLDGDDLERLRRVGFDDEDIWDIGAITGLFALSNRMAHLTDMTPNEEFYLLGRVPRER
jgi:uncharacterized peroxidase-related enzyme